MKKKQQTDLLFNKINNNEVDILIGTQMISKGFNFPKLNCVVVIDADFSGRGYDLRSTEKNIQLYHQLSGRAGRFSSESLIIYQTLTPEDSTLNELIKNKSEQLLKKELLSRKKNKLPPFVRLIAIIISSNQHDLSIKAVSYTHLRAHETDSYLVCRLLLEKIRPPDAAHGVGVHATHIYPTLF